MSDQDTGPDLGTVVPDAVASADVYDIGVGRGVDAPSAAAPEASDVHSEAARRSPVPRDSQWFDELFATHTTAIYRYFARRAPLDDAEDLTADVFATAWRRREVIPEGAELPWLYQTAGFTLANHRRKGRPEPVEVLPEQASGDDPAELAINDAALAEVLRRLSDRDRRILLLNAWEGLSGDELAIALGVSRGGADAALSRARARLREAWGAADGAPS